MLLKIKLPRIKRGVEVGIAFAVARRSVDEDELSVLSDETGIQKVKRPHLVDRRIVNADQAKRRARRKFVFAETEKCIELLSVSVWRGGLRCWLEAGGTCSPTFEGSFRRGHTRKKNQTGSQSARMKRQAVGSALVDLSAKHPPRLQFLERGLRLRNRSLYCDVELSSSIC